MDINWMGRYRGLVEILVKHRNAYARVMNNKTENLGEIAISMLEWEVLEYVIEHENDDASMAQLSDRLAVPPSSLSKISKVLCGYELTAKYQTEDNKKNIILKPTEKGLRFYKERAELLKAGLFDKFFQTLEPFSDEQLELLGKALECLTPADEQPDTVLPKRKYIKIE